MASHRVRKDVDAEFHGDYLIIKSGSRYRVYADASGYSSTSGGYTDKGKVMRDADGKIVSFESIEQAESWIDRGCIVYPEVKF